MTTKLARRAAIAALALGISGAELGCGDGEDTTPATTTTATGGGGAGGGPALDTLEVEVRIGSGVVDGPVAEGAMVVLDKPGGGRVEATTGADGRVRFEGIDWSLEPPGAVTAYLPGHSVHSYVGLTEQTVAWFTARFDADVLTSYVFPAPEADTVTVSGSAVNMTDPANPLVVSNPRWNQTYNGPGADFSLAVPASEPFSLIGLEAATIDPRTVSPRGYELSLLGWTEVDHPAVTESTSGLELDFDQALEPTSISGSFAIPDHGITGFFDSCRGSLLTTTAASDGRAILGLPSNLDVSSDGARFEYELEYVDPGDDTGVFTWLTALEPGKTSRILVPGQPAAGEQPGVLLEPLRLDGSVIPWGGTFSWELNEVDRADDELSINLSLSNRATERLVWYVLAPHGSTSITLPDLPSGADPDEALDFGVLTGSLYLCAPPREVAPDTCGRYATTGPVQVNR